MKKIIILPFIAVIAISCNSSHSTDKEAELNDLLNQQKELNEKIQSLKKELGNQATEKNEKIVSIMELQPTLFQRFVEVQATVDGDESVQLSAKMAGTIESILVKPGDLVKQGQILATMDATILKQTMEEVNVQLDFAKSIYDKQSNLWKQKIGSEVQYLTAKNNKESLEKRYESIKEQFELSRITSPINGTVDEVNIKIGEALAPGFPSIRVVNLNKLKVKGELPETYASKVKTGDKVIVEFPDIPLTLHKKLSYSGKVINPINRTFNVEVRLDPKEGRFIPNMIAILKIVDFSNPNALVIPISLIQNSPNGKFLFIAQPENGKLVAKRQYVETGMEYNGAAEITKGLQAGNKIISNGYLDLAEGDIVSDSKIN